MSFRANSYQQISFTDCMNGLTAEEQKKHCNILGQNFCGRCFPAIDEKPFSVLYS